MKKNKLLFSSFLFLIFILQAVFGLGGLQRQKSILADVGEEKVLEVLVWSDKEEEIELKYFASDYLEVRLSSSLIKISPFRGEEVILVGDKYYNASLIKVYVKPKKEGVHEVFLIATTRPIISGLSARNEIVFKFILNVSSKKVEERTELGSVFKEVENRNILLTFLAAILIVFFSYLIYKKS